MKPIKQNMTCEPLYVLLCCIKLEFDRLCDSSGDLKHTGVSVEFLLSEEAGDGSQCQTCGLSYNACCIILFVIEIVTFSILFLHAIA